MKLEQNTIQKNVKTPKEGEGAPDRAPCDVDSHEVIFLVENKPSENVYTTNTHEGKPEIPDLNVPGNDVDLECDRIIENSTNYVETGEIYERKTTNVDIFFAAKIAKIIDLDPEPKSLLECKKRSDWSK